MTTTSAKAIASHVVRMRSGDQTATLDALRQLLSARRHRAVSVEDAQKFFDRKIAKRRTQQAKRGKRWRDANKAKGVCTRCGDPARIGGTTCEACNENSKAAMRASRAQR